MFNQHWFSDSTQKVIDSQEKGQNIKNVLIPVKDDMQNTALDILSLTEFSAFGLNTFLQ